MRRVIVVGAGFFGGLVARRLRERGVASLVATRRGADLRIDAEDDASLGLAIAPGDVIVDTAGPFASRTTRLVRVAIERGADVIDLAESLSWSERVLVLGPAAADAGVRLYPACSAVAAVGGACVVASGVAVPAEVDLFLAPASAETASPATVFGFMSSLGRPMRTLRDGRLREVRGYAETRRFPVARRAGGLVESAAAVLMPLSWPSLRRAEFWVDPNVPLARASLSLAARVPLLADVARAAAPFAPTRVFGRHGGEFAVVVSDASRAVAFTLRASRGSYWIAVEPAAIAAEHLARGASPSAGVVLPHAQVDPDALFTRLRELGTAIIRA